MSERAEQLTEAYVRKVAKLSRLALTEAEVSEARVALGAVLGYVNRLGELDLGGVEPMPHVGWSEAAGNRLAADEPGGELPVETVMNLAPASMPPFIRVPKVLGEGGGA